MAVQKKGTVPLIHSDGIKKTLRSVISTDVMGNRNLEVKAVGARAEPAYIWSEVEVPDAVKAAAEEQERIRELQEQKAARLKQFQEDVRKRVRHMNRLKYQKQIEKDYEAMETQHQMVRRSLRASDVLVERKDRAILDTPLQQPVSRSISQTIGGNEMQTKVFEKYNKQVHTFTTEARQKLSSRKVEKDLDDLEEVFPGGSWTSSSSKDKKQTLASASSEDFESSDIFRVDSSLEGQGSRRFSAPFLRPQHRADFREAEKENEEEEGWGVGSDDPQGAADGGEEDEEGEEQNAREQRVRFNSRLIKYSPPNSHQKDRKKGSRARSGSKSAACVPDLRSGATEMAERQRQEHQKLSYRRLYSDLERQSVRDSERRKQQHRQVQRIKKEKEQQRRIEEEKARRIVEARDPATGETPLETSLRHELERSHLEETMQEIEGQRQKQKEMIRYLDALRSNLQDKLQKRGRELPSLCCCGTNLWDTHPDTCANNCFYYKNHRAYARALQSLLNSSDIL